MTDESERVVYRTSVSTDMRSSSNVVFDNLDAAKAFVEARIAANNEEKNMSYWAFDSWGEGDDKWAAYIGGGWAAGFVTKERIHSHADEALRTREDTYD
jgi:hypothetical protein